jgi:hypothetical protein
MMNGEKKNNTAFHAVVIDCLLTSFRCEGGAG